MEPFGRYIMIWVIIMLSATVSKLVTYDFQTSGKMFCNLKKWGLEPKVFFVCMVVSGVLTLLLVVDLLHTASKQEVMASNVYFFVLTTVIGYSITHLFVTVYRNSEGVDERVLRVDTFKHVAHVALDVLTMGFLVYASVFDAYNRPFKGTQLFLTTDDLNALS